MQTYSYPARALHWLTVILLIALFTTGTWMTYRGDDLKLWDATTNALYSTHKSIGLILLAVIAIRLAYRLIHGAPPDPETLSPVQRIAAHVVHWSLYALLLVIPLIGWLGISMFPALDVFGAFKIPALTGADREASKFMFELHETLGDALLFLITLHVAAALTHQFILKDGLLRRMWPAKPTR